MLNVNQKRRGISAIKGAKSRRELQEAMTAYCGLCCDEGTWCDCSICPLSVARDRKDNVITMKVKIVVKNVKG